MTVFVTRVNDVTEKIYTSQSVTLGRSLEVTGSLRESRTDIQRHTDTDTSYTETSCTRQNGTIVTIVTDWHLDTVIPFTYKIDFIEVHL